MQDLRKKLLKAGLVDKKQARTAQTERRLEKKKRGGARAEEDAAREQQQRHAERLAQQSEQARQREQERALAQQRHELENQVRNIVERNARRKILGDDCTFCFVGLDNHVRRLNTTHPIRQQLIDGDLGLVAAPHDKQRDFRVVDDATVERLEQLDPASILFWNRPGTEGELPTYGATGPGSRSD